MTIASERFSAIRHTREFLRSLLDPKKTPKVPKEIRIRAGDCLRHFPSDQFMAELRVAAPEFFGRNNE